MSKKKIAIIGSGNIGGTIAQLILFKKLGNIILFDIIQGKSQGKALDLLQCSPIEEFNNTIIGSNDYSDIQGSDIVVVTAGITRKPGMNRNDLLLYNGNIIKNIGEKIRKYAPNAFVICITNPLDTMVSLLQHFSQISDKKIVGMAGILDTARFRTFLSLEFHISITQIHAYVLGGHGDTMVPLISSTNIAGQSLNNLIKKGIISRKKIDNIITRTKKGGGEIINFLKKGSAFYAPSSATVQIIESYLEDKKYILPCSAKIRKGEYGIKNKLFFGVPICIGSKGIEQIIEIPLNKQEKIDLQRSVDIIRKNNVESDKIFIKSLSN